MEPYGIGWAIDAMRDGLRVTRRGWNGPGQYLKLVVPAARRRNVSPGPQMTLPYIYITTVQGDQVPWLASQTDILATDWECVPE